MGLVHQEEPEGQETVVGVVTQDSLAPALVRKLADKRVRVSN